ncbi:MAG: hypothetical protein B7Y55_10055 [Polynucleobacter sp. 35-46-207]|nr:MAG: hypothetical protein B7Y55_10055 [Polynucleobacter sp. 35-46-207]
MSLLECLVGIGLSFALIAPLIQNSGELISKQIAYEKSQALSQDVDRALELMGRSIRMAGYMHPNSFLQGNKQHSSSNEFMQIQKSCIRAHGPLYSHGWVYTSKFIFARQ